MAEDSDNALLPRIGGGGIPAPVLVNPLAAQNAGLQTAKGMWDVQHERAKEAAGQAYQGAINQQTGEFDPNEFRRRLAASGPAAMEAGAALLNTQNITSDQLNQNLKKANWVNQRAGAQLLSGDFSDAGMLRIFQEGLANGNLTMPEVQRQMQLIPPDADGRRRYLQEHQDTSAQIETQLKERYGQTGSQVGPDGRTIGTVQQPARSGGSISSPPQQGAPLGMDPAQIAQYQLWLKSPRDYPDPANPTVTKHGTNETFQRDSGVPEKFIYPGGAPATPGTPPSPLGTGRPPATLLNPNKPQAAPAPAPTPTPSPAGTGISGPTPAQTATAAATVEQGKLGPPKFQQHADEDASAQSQQAILGTMLSDLNKFQSGSGAGKTLDIKRALTSWAPSVARSFNIKPDEVAGQESFDKLASQLALQQQGGTTDHRMDINAAANPHSSLSPEGADFIIRSLQGNSDYIRAKASLAAKWPDKANYPAFQESIKELDPRVFQMARMKDEQRQTYWKSLDTEAQKQIDAAGKKARELGVLGG